MGHGEKFTMARTYDINTCTEKRYTLSFHRSCVTNNIKRILLGFITIPKTKQK